MVGNFLTCDRTTIPRPVGVNRGVVFPIWRLVAVLGQRSHVSYFLQGFFLLFAIRLGFLGLIDQELGVSQRMGLCWLVRAGKLFPFSALDWVCFLG